MNKNLASLTSPNALKIGVIASLKRGVEQFIYREVSHLEETGATITLYPTKIGDGLYPPKASWNLARWTLLGILWAQIITACSMPMRYTRTMLLAIRYGAIPDFILGVYFAKSMNQQDAIYSTFGDRKLFVGFFAKRLVGVPLMCTVHAYEIYQNPNPRLFRLALAECDQLITISEFNRQEIHERYGYPKEQIEIVTYSIDLQEYTPAKKFVVLIVGFFVERKGHDILFQAVKQLANPDIEIWVVGGEGAESDSVDVKAMARKYEIESQVAFLGKQSGTALRAMYHACDVFCLPCHFDRSGVGEGFPNVIIEAMASGKPVIATRHVAIPSILRQILVNEKDVEGLAAAINQLAFQSQQNLDELGLQNRKLAEENFSPSNVERTAEVAMRLCGKQVTRKSGTKIQVTQESPTV